MTLQIHLLLISALYNPSRVNIITLPLRWEVVLTLSSHESKALLAAGCFASTHLPRTNRMHSCYDLVWASPLELYAFQVSASGGKCQRGCYCKSGVKRPGTPLGLRGCGLDKLGGDGLS